MRGSALALCLAVAVGSLVPGTVADASTAELVQQLDRLTSAFAGGAGIYISDPNANKALYAHNADEPVITASLYKLAILAEAERRVDAGQLRYADTVRIEDEDITENGSFEPAGTELTLDEALEAMITISDNGAALALWHILGPENINATLLKAGINDFHVQLSLEEDNVATPRAVGTLFTLLATRRLISPAASDRMLARLERQQINNRLPAALPGVVVAHKTGNLPGLTHDAGIIYTKFGPRVVVAMTWDAYEPDADAFIADVGSIVYSAVLEPPANAKYDVPKRVIIVDAGSTPRITLPISNTGTTAWAGSGPGSVRLIWEMRDSKDALVASSKTPIPLPGLAPGRSANVGVDLTVPKVAGDYKVTLGLVDFAGTALASLGAATATFPIRAHVPYIVSADVVVPTILHAGEASLLQTAYVAQPTAGSSIHSLSLAWRVIDLRNGRTVTQGTSLVGTLQPGASGTFFSPLIAPNVLGSYKLSYELRERNVAASETITRAVTIEGPRTYPDDEGGRSLPLGPQRAAPSPTPSSTPRFKFPTPTGGTVPNVQLPALPTPRGRASPSPTP